jgi:hypothetical protein
VKLNDLKNEFQHYSERLCTSGRQLALGGLGFTWLLVYQEGQFNFDTRALLCAFVFFVLTLVAEYIFLWKTTYWHVDLYDKRYKEFGGDQTAEIPSSREGLRVPSMLFNLTPLFLLIAFGSLGLHLLANATN